MKGLSQIMRQAQEMQANMQKVQNELAATEVEGVAGGVWQLLVPADKEHLNTQALRTRLEAALREQYGREARLSIAVGQPERPTPAELRRSGM